MEMTVILAVVVDIGGGFVGGGFKFEF